MWLTELTCRRFRCLGEIDFTPGPGLNIIHGDNAQGKTSLLEALLYVCTARSHRTQAEGELVQHGEDGFSVAAKAERSDRAVSLEANYWQKAKRFKINGVAQARVSDILGRVNTVFFSPEDVSLIKGSATGRRRFLDMEISQINGRYLSALQQYRQILKQRNSLLKHPNPDPAMLDVWDAQLIPHGETLMVERDAFVSALAVQATEAYGRIAADEAMVLAYAPDLAQPTDFESVLRQSRETDLRRRQTTRGPHRDDMSVTVSGKSARVFGSQGQQKSAALALKLAEIELINDQTGEYPVLMLDEVLAELDAHRAQHLFESLEDKVQCLVTTTERELADKIGGRPYRRYEMIRGQLEAQEET
jgi:DNA replication and repair protein RecF